MLTGRFAFRKNWRGKMILQVEHEEREPTSPYGDCETVKIWQDAKEKQAQMIVSKHDGLKVRP